MGPPVGVVKKEIINAMGAVFGAFDSKIKQITLKITILTPKTSYQHDFGENFTISGPEALIIYSFFDHTHKPPPPAGRRGGVGGSPTLA